MYAHEEAEGKRLKNPFDTVTEGIGINRLTENFKLAQLDGAFQGTDREAVEMSRSFQNLTFDTINFEALLYFGVEVSICFMKIHKSDLFL